MKKKFRRSKILLSFLARCLVYILYTFVYPTLAAFETIILSIKEKEEQYYSLYTSCILLHKLHFMFLIQVLLPI